MVPWLLAWALADEAHVQPMRQATLLRIPIVDSNIEHKVVGHTSYNTSSKSNTSGRGSSEMFSFAGSSKTFACLGLA